MATKGQIHTPCTFLVTDETIPRPPTNCEAKKNTVDDITVTCEKGHDGGLPQVSPMARIFLLIKIGLLLVSIYRKGKDEAYNGASSPRRKGTVTSAQRRMVDTVGYR